MIHSRAAIGHKYHKAKKRARKVLKRKKATEDWSSEDVLNNLEDLEDTEKSETEVLEDAGELAEKGAEDLYKSQGDTIIGEW
jgi:hypothetical protein